MNINRLRIAATLAAAILALASSPAFSDLGNMGPALSYAAICGSDTAALKAAREKRRLEGLKAIEPEILPRFEAIAKKYGLPQPQSQDFIVSTLQSVAYTYSQNAGQAKEALLALSEAIEEAVFKRVPLPDYARIKANLIAGILKEPNLDAGAKTELVRRVRLTDMVLPSRYIRDYITSTDELWPVIPNITADQAWNASYDELGGAGNPNLAKDQSAVIVYMGLLLAEERGGSELSQLDYVLSHETSHSIDSGRLPGLYAGFIGCMKKRYHQDFQGWDEVLADYWADQAVAQFLIKLGSQSEKLDYLRKSYQIICGTSSEDDALIINSIKADHPSGQYRIENILGNDPDVLKALGLPLPDSEVRTCRP